MSTDAAPDAALSAGSVALDECYELHPSVSLRAERFGALAYSFDTRTLSFLKHPDLVAVVSALGDHATVRAAFEAVGVEQARWPSFQRALAALETSEMIRAV